MAHVWDCGEQTIRHGQLVEGHGQFNIICICYSWLHEKKVHTLHYDYDTQDPSEMIKQFDAIVKKADIVVGKNSRKFDIKMINTVRMLRGLPPFPDWAANNSDLESQFRKHFRLPSQSLDYVAKVMGYGGKSPMEFKDWVNIKMKTPDGPKAFIKMLKYCAVDVKITKQVMIKSFPYIISDINYSDYCTIIKNRKVEKLACRTCGSHNLRRNGTRLLGRPRVVYQRLECVEHEHFAGYIQIDENGEYKGRMK